MMLHAGICDSGMWGCVLVGASMGGLVALDLAIARPDLISSLVLVGSALDDHLWSEPVQRYGEAEEAAAHLPSLERPALFDEAVLSFLADQPQSSGPSTSSSSLVRSSQTARR